MTSPKNSVVIFAYARRNLLEQSIQSVLNASGSSEWNKIIVLQQGFPEVLELVMAYKEYFDLMILTTPKRKTVLGNINENRILGTSIGFTHFDSQVVLGIEEDTEIAQDSLDFVSEMHKRYRHRRAFRGVNLGSIEPLSQGSESTYSLLRYGLHGQAGAITRKTWLKLDFERLNRTIESEGWDSVFEYSLKTGFMVTPNASRSLDRGWAGTHSPQDPNHPHYVKMQRSWLANYSGTPSSYVHANVLHSWRKDAVAFKKINSFSYQLIATRFGRNIYNWSRRR